MTPTYEAGSYLLVSKWPIQYARYDVVIFRYPQDNGTIFIKRIVGLPGETVTIANGKININGLPLNDPYISGQIAPDTSLALGNDQYFVLGDNLSQSFDSRSFGAISKTEIEGKVIYKVY